MWTDTEPELTPASDPYNPYEEEDVYRDPDEEDRVTDERLDETLRREFGLEPL